MKISLQDLKIAIEKILTHLEREGKKEFEIKKDYYWFIPSAELYNPYTIPDHKSFTIGQLSQDIEAIIEISQDKKEPIGYSLVWIAAVLRSIGENNVS